MRGFTLLLALLLFASGFLTAQAPEPPIDILQNIFGPVQQVIYENVDNYRMDFKEILPGGGIGDTVWLAGFARSVTRAEFLIGATNNVFMPSVAVEAELSLWQPGPYLPIPNNSPGTLLWKSGYQPFTLMVGAKNPVSFKVPKVKVDNLVVWTLTFRDFLAYVQIPIAYQYGPPTVGDGDLNGFWQLNPLSAFWSYGTAGSLNQGSFYCRLIAE